MRSAVEIFTLSTGRSRIVHETDQLIEAPNFTRDGQALLLNGEGLLFSLPVEGGG